MQGGYHDSERQVARREPHVHVKEIGTKRSIFYAIYQPYGCWTGSSRDTLMRFDTAAERDELVHRINNAHYDKPEGVCRPMTARDASYAFDLSKFDDDPYGDTCRELNGVRTRANRSVFEIRQRQSRLASH